MTATSKYTKPTLSEYQNSIQAKINRATSHFEDLRRLIGEFVHGSCRLVADLDAKAGKYIVKVESANPDPMWGTVIGDCVHNFRSALDSLACALVVKGLGQVRSKTGFPITNHARDLPDEIEHKMCAASPDVRAKIAEMEPYREGAGHRLWLLHKIDIADKHQLVVPIVGAYPGGVISANYIRNGVCIDTTEFSVDFTFPAANGTEIHRLPVAEGTTEVELHQNDVFRVGFRQPEPLYGELVLGTLYDIHLAVEETVAKLTPFLG